MFSCNLPPALLAEWLGFFTCYRGNTGWNGYRNKSQHRKSTLEKRILPPFQQGFKPATFQSRVRRSNHWAIPAPVTWIITITFKVPSTVSHTIVWTHENGNAVLAASCYSLTQVLLPRFSARDKWSVGERKSCCDGTAGDEHHTCNQCTVLWVMFVHLWL